MSTSNYTEKQLIKMRGPRRELAIDNFSQTSVASAWYYRVNVSVYEDVLASTFIDEIGSSDSCSEDDRSSDDSFQAIDVEHYSISRRYSDFLQVYEQIRDTLKTTEGSSSSLPSFPAKEFIPPALKCMLRRSSSSKVVLEDRTAKFEALLQWIENHPVARSCQGYLKFIGKPPQSHDGYVSLKEYTPPDWLASLNQTTKGVERRRRRYSTGNTNSRERSMSEVSANFRRENLVFAKEVSSMHGSNDMVGRYSV